MHSTKHFLLTGILLMIMVLSAFSQQKTVIHIEKAKEQQYNKNLGPDIERLIGNVVLRQDSTWFYCDSAHLNEKSKNFDAFGNVHIKVSDTLNIYGDLLKYNGERREAELFNNVKLIDDTTILETEYLIYYRMKKLAVYPDHGIITSGENVLKSKRGYYQSDRKEFYFSQDVELINPEYTTYTDTMMFNTRTETAWFYSPTLMRGDDRTVYTEYGWYNTRTDIAQLERNNQLSGQEQYVESDWMFYDRNTGYGYAKGNVVVTDTTHKMILKGNTGRIWEDEGRSYVTDNALAITYDKNDSLYLHADTLFMFFDSLREAREMRAYFNVRFFRTDLQGVCDSLVYHSIDSTMRMYKSPVLWSSKNQLTADSIFIIIANEQLDSLVMYNSAFIVSRDSIEGFNQIKGKNMVGFFLENELDKIDVDGNAQTVYWVREDDGNLVGINLARSSTMSIKLEENTIKGITYFSSPAEVMYPLKDLPREESVLKGFKWLSDQRPSDKNDIFRKVEKEQLILEEKPGNEKQPD
ncbi:MAG TPA: OstA-like protein [Bacteroidales bacterium]|nr:OstA-like protein [Bacteroidales bacterium]